MKNSLFIIGILGSILFSSCLKDKHKNDGRICSMEYRMLTVSVKDSLGDPVILDDYFVKKTATGEIIDFAREDPYFDSIARMQGNYIICTDGQMGMTSIQGTEFEFHGFMGSTGVVSEKYFIGNDECHVYLIAGKQEIILSQ